MSALTVRRLATECRVPRALDRIAATADTVARGQLRHDVGARLGPSLDRSEEIVRIRLLPVRVAMPAAAFDESALAEAWTSAFVRSLFQALACPGGSVAPFAVARYQSRAAQLAALLRDALSGAARDRWEYREFHASGAIEDPLRVFALCGDAPEIRDVLVALAPVDLEQILSRMDDAALDSLFARLDISSSATLTIHDVIASITLVLELAPRRIESTSGTALRRLAMRMYALALSRSLTSPPRSLFHALLAATSLASSSFDLVSAANRDLPSPVVDFLTSLRAIPDALLDALRTSAAAFTETILPSYVAAAVVSRQHERERETAGTISAWIASPFAAIFLLAPLADLLGWPAMRRDPAIGERGFQLFLIAVALRVLRMGIEIEDDDDVDPAVALFGGCTGPIDRSALREFDDTEERAGELVAALRLRIRGFREATFAAIVRQFIARPGRIRVDDERITVVLDPSPFHVALRISGIDQSVASLDWLGRRELNVVLEGL